MRNSIVAVGAVIGCFAAICLVSAPQFGPRAHAQSKSSSVKSLDVRAQKLQADFVRDSAELARDYERAGELEKARQVYSALSRLNPQAKDLRESVQRVEEAILTANAFEIDLDTGVGWGIPRARVTKGKPFQVQAAGTYRFQATLPVGPAGFSTADPTKNDLAANVRCGALMGLIVTKGKPGKPFFIGASREITASETGLLYLRVNTPAGAKCTGRLNVKLSGYVDRN